jgi:phosphatidate cytidylyltransferase
MPADSPPARPGGTPPSASRWRDLRTRVLSAALLLPVAVFCIWSGGWPWVGAVAVAGALLAWEWVRLCAYTTQHLPGMAVPIAVLAAGAAAVAGGWGSALLILVAGCGAVWWLAGSPVLRRGGAAWVRQPAAPHPVWLAFGVVYVGAAGLALLRLRLETGAGLGNVLFVFLVVWASDIGAYMAGRALGGPKLAPAVSPNKTWSGAVGGLLSSVTAGVLTAYVMEHGLSGQAAVVAAVLGVVSQAGDLFESWIKRRFHVKDSSSLIPGHGGLLDRLDGVLAAAPVAALIGLHLGAGEWLWH